MLYLTRIQEHKRLLHTAIERAAILVMRKSYDSMLRTAFNPIFERFQAQGKDRAYMMAFSIRGLMAIISEWPKGDCKDSIESIVSVMQKCIPFPHK